MTEYDDRGRAVMWKRERTSKSTPSFSGEVTAHRDIRSGEKLDIAFWRNEKWTEGGKQPALTGKMSDKREYVGHTTGPSPGYTPPPTLEEDIPF